MKPKTHASVSKKVSLGKNKHVVIVQSEYHADIVQPMMLACVAELVNAGMLKTQIKTVAAPGAFELPFLAQKSLKNKNCVGAIILGCVIRGDTPHFDYVCQGVTFGTMLLQAVCAKPIIMGVLTVINLKQAKVRADARQLNKGAEFAQALVEVLGARLRPL